MTEQSHQSGIRHALRRRLLTLADAPGLENDVAELRTSVDSSVAQAASDRKEVEDLSQQLTVVSGRIDALESEVGTTTASDMERLELVRRLETSVASLAAAVTQLSERVHLQQVEIQGLRTHVERMVGSVQDEMALDRRLSRIENRLLDLDVDS